MPKNINLNLPNKRLVIAVAAIVALGFLLWAALLWVFFSQDSVREQTIAALEQQLGRKVNQADAVEFSLLPTPQLIMHNLNAENDPRSRQPSMLRVPMVEVDVHPYSLFSSNLLVEIRLISPRVELETFDDGSSSWEVRSTGGEKESALITGLEIVEGELHYSYPAVEREITVRQINAGMHFPSESKVESAGAMNISNANYQFNLKAEAEDGDNKHVELGVFDGITALSVKGKWNSATKAFDGEQKLESNDLGTLIRSFVPKRDAVAAQATTTPPAAEMPAYPMQCSSRVQYTGDKLTLSGITFAGDFTQGAGEVSTTISAQPEITARFDFDKFSLSPLVDRGIIYDILTHSDSTEIVKGFKVNLPQGRKTALPKGMTLALTLTSKEISLVSLPATNLQLAATLKDSRITIDQFSGQLPGETQFIVKGAVEGGFEGLSLKGQLDVGGKEFNVFAPYVLGENLALPERLKQFRGRANIFLTPDLVRMSETILRVEDYQLLGTILRNRQETVPEVKYEGALRVDNLNLDELGSAQKASESKELAQYPKLFHLVKQWQSSAQKSSLDFKVNLFDMTLGGQKRPRTAFELAVNGGGVALNQLQTSYNGTTLSGSIGIAFPAQGLPEIQADIKADMLNTKDFFEHDFMQDASIWRDPDGTWSKQEFALDWARQYSGRISLVVGMLTHEIYQMSDVFLDIESKDSAVQVNKFNAGIWGGQLSLRGQMLANKLPSANGLVELKGVDIVQLKSTTTLFGDLLGRVNLSGEFTTTGVNPHIAVQNAQGTLSVSGRGLTITGFNLANMVRAANAVRTVDDIDKLVQFADQGGTTSVDVMQGNVNLAGGYLRSPGIMIGTQEGSGTINGQLSLLDWNLNAAITVYLSALQQQSPPSIRLIFAGPLNQAARSLDTQSLESFIAKQAAERILETR